MSNPTITKLHQMEQHLHSMQSASYSEADKQALREMLNTTIHCFQALYPDNFNFPQRIQLLHHLSVLEQETFELNPPSDVPLPEWQSVHQTLLTTIDTTLINAANAHRNAGPAASDAGVAQGGA